MRVSTGELAQRQLSYGPAGLTTTDEWLTGAVGFHTYERRVPLGTGSDRWTFAAHAVKRWGVKTRSGFTVEDEFRVSATGDPVAVGDRRWLVAHLGPWKVREPIEVVAVVDEPDRQGFAYGTLTGHPLRGEEAFIVERLPDGSLWLTVRSATRRQTGRWGFAYPAVLVAQRFYRRRYLRALAGPMN